MFSSGTICTFGLVTLLAQSIVLCAKIHDHMADDDIANVFHTTRDNVPEYDVASIKHNLYKRSSSNLRLEFNAFGKKIEAYLYPSDGVLAGENTPVWLASTNPNGTVDYKKMPANTIGTAVRTFVDLRQQSTIVAYKLDDGRISFKGLVNGFHVIPLPKHLTIPVTSERILESPNSSKNLMNSKSCHHVITRSMLSPNGNRLAPDVKRQNYTSQAWNRIVDKEWRHSKEIIYPSILVVTDFASLYTPQNAFGYYDEIVYQLAFWNAVDLRFRQVTDPKIRLRISGIIIGLDRKAIPYVNVFRTGNVINLPEYLQHFGDYWIKMTENSDFPLEAFDVVITVTNNEMTRRVNGEMQQIMGLATTGSLCPYKRIKFNANAIISDRGGFGGVPFAVHELGHVFGLAHDGNTGDECDASHLYIMHPTTSLGPKSLEWSPCSLRTLSYYLNQYYINCVDQPDEFHPPGDEVERLLPDDIVTVHQQCQGRGYDMACATSSETCTNMQCYYTGLAGFTKGWWCKDAGPAAEGTTCSPGHRCFSGVCQCVSKECASKRK